MDDTVSAPTQNDAFAKVEFKPDPGKDLQLMFDGLKGHEELGRPFLYELDLSSGKLRGDMSSLLGSSATVTLSQSDADHKERYINGIVTRVVSAGLTGGSYRYHIEVRPTLWLLTRITDCRIFNDKEQTPFKILSKVLQEAGVTVEDKRQAGAGNEQIEYCVQYRETTFDFLMRLMEQYGLYYFFNHDKDQHTLVLVDDPNAHQSVGDALPFQFDRTEYRTVSDHLWEWSTELALHSGKFMFQDYNFETPSADLAAKTAQPGPHSLHNSYEVYEYPGFYDQQADGRRLTDVRMQEISASRAIYKGASNSRKLHAGWKFRISDYPDDPVNREYLITRSEISLSIAEGLSNSAEDSSGAQGELLDTYRVTLHAIPADVPFRLPRRTPRPMIRGPQTARVVGQDSEEITTDKYGRIKVRFHWDRSDKRDEDRTCWIRVAQPWAGASWGAMFIPRVGQEVVVEFLEGDPDRPLVTGSVYNANLKVPYDLPDNKTISVIKSNSSTGGNGSNELRFEDKAGSEEIFLHAQKDYTKKVLNNEAVTIHKDTSTTVETGNRSVTVSQGSDSLTVSTGNHEITVSAGCSTVKATQSITLQVGPNSIVIDMSGVSISGTLISLN
jgi:type VI secretion system secreted protein VgrG